MLCLCMASFMRSIAPSASALMASCTWTCNTRWLPPFRSSPSRILWRRFFVRVASDFGNCHSSRFTVIRNTQSRITATMTTVLPVTFFFMRILALLKLTLCKLLLLAFGRHQVGNRATGHLQLNIVGFHTQHQRIVVADCNDGPHDPAAGKHRVPILQRAQHLLRVLLLALHGKEQEKVEDSEDQDNGENSTQHGTAGDRCLENQI